MMDFINQHFTEILTFFGGLISGITLTISTQKILIKRDRNTTNQNNNQVTATGSVKFTGGDDNS